MAHFSAHKVKESLNNSIKSLFDRRQDFFNNPSSSFTREKKISFEQTIIFPMIAGSDNVDTELLDYFGEDKLPSQSAMIQRRNQVKPEAFKELFHDFTRQIPVAKTYKGYRLVACDGTRLNLPYNSSDKDTFFKCKEDRKGINQLHMNALYDTLNDIFLDIELQRIREMDEMGSLCHFFDNGIPSNPSQKWISLADRGYASFNVFAHAIHNNRLFLIRASKSFVDKMCRNHKHLLDANIADFEIIVHIGRRNTNELKKLDNYHCVPSTRRYDYLEADSNEFECLKLRVLKFPISETTCEYIVTNLPSDHFSVDEIKELYHIRWNQETAFRFLKYAGNMVHIHSIKKEFLLQEIYAKLTFYNFCSALASSIEASTKDTSKHKYAVNHTQMQKICIRFIRGVVKNVEQLIAKFVEPIRLGRKYIRIIRTQSADSLAYR